MIHTSMGDFALKYTYNAMVEHEERFKIPLLIDAAKTDPISLRRLIWSGLLYTGKNFTLSKVGDLIEDAIIGNDQDIVDLHKEIEKAIDDSVFLQRLAEKSVKRRLAENQ